MTCRSSGVADILRPGAIVRSLQLMVAGPDEVIS
jgi:hypothetical protein